MAEYINANGSVPQSTAGYVQVTISSSTNASPIVVTFTGNHNSQEGDTWQIEGHLVNTAANSTWQVHVVSATQLALIGSTGNGVGAATGYGIDYAVNPLLQVPDDGDLANGASISTPVEGVFNCIPFMYQRVGKYRFYDRQILANAGGTLASYPNAWLSQSIASGSWVEITGSEFTYPNTVFTSDILVCEIIANQTGVGTGFTFGMAIGFSISGGGFQIGGSFDGVNQPTMWSAGIADFQVRANYAGPVRSASLPITNGGLRLAVMGFQNSGSNKTFQLVQPYTVTVAHYRINS